MTDRERRFLVIGYAAGVVSMLIAWLFWLFEAHLVNGMGG